MRTAVGGRRPSRGSRTACKEGEGAQSLGGAGSEEDAHDPIRGKGGTGLPGACRLPAWWHASGPAGPLPPLFLPSASAPPCPCRRPQHLSHTTTRSPFPDQSHGPAGPFPYQPLAGNAYAERPAAQHPPFTPTTALPSPSSSFTTQSVALFCFWPPLFKQIRARRFSNLCL